MSEKDLRSFFENLKKERKIFGPSFFEEKIYVRPLEKFADLAFEKALPVFPFKNFFLPEKEPLFEYKGERLREADCGSEKIALLGMNLLDLKAVLLYDQVFEKDACYQQRRQNILIIGHNLLPESLPAGASEKIEEDLLEHLAFDIFLMFLPGEKDLAVFSGSPLGQETLEKFGFKDYIHIQFSGPVKEGALNERMLRLKDKLENHHQPEIWDKLGERCLECGKCTLSCPTCFCFRMDDQPSLALGQGQRSRCWDSCYFQEFSEVSGGYKFLNNTAKRIHFWYFHKFARIPAEFNFIGCVGCRRCAEVCPVGIDIKEVLKEIENT